MPENIHLFARLTKVDPIQGLAYGTAAAEEPDKSGEIFDYASSKPNFEAWSDGIAKATAGKSLGNVRAMHGSVAAGKLTTISFDDANKRIEVCAKIVDKAELEKLVEGVYTGFSIGGKYAKRWPDEGDKKLTRYTALPSELSIVDNPCIPTATFACVKGDGTEEMRKFHAPTTEPAPAAIEPAPELAQVWQAKDGKTFGKKADAEQHNATLAKAADADQTPSGKLAAALDVLKVAVAKLGDPADVTVAKKDYSDDERKAMADKGEAMPGGKFPIANKSDSRERHSVVRPGKRQERRQGAHQDARKGARRRGCAAGLVEGRSLQGRRRRGIGQGPRHGRAVRLSASGARVAAVGDGQ